MATITQIRGALLEEAVLFLLKNVGYDPVDMNQIRASPVPGLRIGHSGFEVQGRGTWHQLDAFARWQHSPAFIYPLQLIIEAKCYSKKPVGVEVTRNSVGVLKDISENFFTISTGRHVMQSPRFNYASAIFSTSGFTQGAVEYAIAHQIFLIQYDDVAIMKPLIDSIFDFDDSCVDTKSPNVISKIRLYYRATLHSNPHDLPDVANVLKTKGIELIESAITEACKGIRGSYFGMLQGRWPLHLLRREPLPPAAFPTDSVQCKVIRSNGGGWKFVPLSIEEGNDSWFELEFSLPKEIADLVSTNQSDPFAIADIKQDQFSYIDLSGLIGGIRRNIRLELDRSWIRDYVRRLRMSGSRNQESN